MHTERGRETQRENSRGRNGQSRGETERVIGSEINRTAPLREGENADKEAGERQGRPERSPQERKEGSRQGASSHSPGLSQGQPPSIPLPPPYTQQQCSGPGRRRSRGREGPLVQSAAHIPPTRTPANPSLCPAICPLPQPQLTPTHHPSKPSPAPCHPLVALTHSPPRTAARPSYTPPAGPPRTLSQSPSLATWGH